MAAPSMTFNAAGNLIAASTNLAAGASTTVNVDASTKIELQILVNVTLGGTVATTHGIQVDALPGYGSTVAYGDTPVASVAAAQATAASGSDTAFLALPTGKYQIKITNLDASNAVTIEATSATVDSYA